MVQKENTRRQAEKNPATKKANPESPSRLIDAMLKEQRDWRGKTLAHIRALIKQADPDVVEELKWQKPSNPAGVPVWSHDGMICTGETYKHYVKLTFAKGAVLEDPDHLFNASLEGNVRRAIDIRENDTIEEEAFKALIQAAIVENQRSSVARSRGRGRK